jgi:4-hydroxybenzoate polyprenyltransferase
MAIKPYLQLVRLPNVFTAAADSLAGWLLVMGTFQQPERWVPLCLASMAIYAAGIVFNDLFDLEIDRLERPGRPLPSGRVRSAVASMLASALVALGLLLAMASGKPSSGLVALLLVLAVLAYDGGLKRTWLGPLAMGACRGLNVLLGMSQAPQLGGHAAWLVAGALAVFVVGITWISRSEASGGHRAGPVAGWCLENLGLLGLLTAALLANRFPMVGTEPRPIVPLEGLLVLLVVTGIVNAASSAAARDPVPTKLQHAVKTGVLSLVWLNVGVVAAVRGVLPALAVAALWVPAFALGKWLYST